MIDRKGEGVVCYIKHEIDFSTKNIFSKNISHLSGFVSSKIKPISAGIVYRRPNDTNFLQLFVEILNCLKILENETFRLSGMTMIIL